MLLISKRGTQMLIGEEIKISDNLTIELYKVTHLI